MERSARALEAYGGTGFPPGISRALTGGMTNSMTREGIHMDGAWRQMLAAALVVVTVIALGVLEVVTARLPVDQSVTVRMKAGEGPAEPLQDVLVETSLTEASEK